MFKETPLDDWKAYLRWHLIDATAPDLSKDFVDEDFNFNERILRGAQQIKPRWKRVIESEDGRLARRSVSFMWRTIFRPEQRSARPRDGQQFERSAADRIKTLDWMDEPTKEEALKKLAAMQVKIGYPDKWLDYSLLRIDRGPLRLERLPRREVCDRPRR